MLASIPHHISVEAAYGLSNDKGYHITLRAVALWRLTLLIGVPRLRVVCSSRSPGGKRSAGLNIPQPVRQLWTC